MSDEGLINLEDDAPTPPAAPVAAVPAAEPPAAEPPVEDDKPAEVEAVEVGGQKYVPVSAIRAERERRQSAEKDAQRAGELERQLNELRPYAEFVKNNPALLQPRQPEPVPAAPSADPDAVEAAKLMDFYKPDGTPDVDRGSRWLAMQDKRAARVAQERTQPLIDANLRQAATSNYNLLLNLKHQDGTPVQRSVVDATWTRLMQEPNGLNTAADPQSLAVLGLMVLGADGMTRKAKVEPPAQPPVVTEASGGHPQARPALSDLEAKVAKDRGRTQKQWVETTANYQRGITNALEDN